MGGKRLAALVRSLAVAAAAGAAGAALPGLAWAASPSPAVDSTGCLQVGKTGPSASCTTPSSLTVELRNTCKFAVRAQLCLRGANHLWVACSDSNSLAPKDVLVGNSCDSDGAYTYWGCAKFDSHSGKCGGNDLVGKASNVTK